jgi:hypothetical protein
MAASGGGGAAMMLAGERDRQFYRLAEGRTKYGRNFLLCLLLGSLFSIFAGGCSLFHDQALTNQQIWQDTDPPKLPLREKAQAYQGRLESRFQMPEGLIWYRRFPAEEKELKERLQLEYLTLADGCFHLGMYLASQALRLATTGDPKAREQVLLSLRAMKLYAELSGERGLLVRYFSPAIPNGKPNLPRWRQSTTHPEYFFLSDVSRDQYAGYIHGLGVTLAVVSDPEIRSLIAPLAGAIADHLIDNDLQIKEPSGTRKKPTTYGDLHGWSYGFIPNGVNSLICLAIAKTAAESTGEQKHINFYKKLVQDGYPRITRWTYLGTYGKSNRVNANMAYVALYPLLLLENDPEIVKELRKGAQRTWSRVSEDHNVFFSFVHAAVVGDVDEAKEKGVQALREFPDRKLAVATRKSEPKSGQPTPLNLRPYVSAGTLWVGDPTEVVGHLVGDVEIAGIDYLVAYWLGRYYGFIGPDE